MSWFSDHVWEEPSRQDGGIVTINTPAGFLFVLHFFV